MDEHQLHELATRFRVEAGWPLMQRAFEVICKEPLSTYPAGSSCQRSSLNGSGVPIQFALTLGAEAPPLQFLSEIGESNSGPLDEMELTARKLRSLSTLLQVEGDIDSLICLIERTSAPNIYDLSPDSGGNCWLGASVARDGRCGLKIYLNGKNGSEAERWNRVERFAEDLGFAGIQDRLWRTMGASMLPLGMGLTLSQSKRPAGRLYFHGYGNRLDYYEHLLRHFGSAQHVEAFRQYTEIMLGDDRAYPTQSVVFSVGFNGNNEVALDIKIEFCAHCVFQSDAQARERCLQWLAMRQIESHSYRDMLTVLAGPVSEVQVNSHVYLGLGWKRQQEYTTIYLKPIWRSPGSEQ
jgi:hypothetical protein